MTGFGAFLSSNHPPERQWDLARRVDALGFDSIWTGDHVSFLLNPICEPEEEGEQLEAIASELLPRLET